MSFEHASPPGGVEIYIQLVWLFTVIISILMLCLCYLYLSMRRAREQEQMSREFSQLVIEGLETERRRISRELHDTVLPQVHDSAISDMIRLICIDLMPPDFTRLSLKDSLALLCAQFSQRTKIELACSIEDNLDFSHLCALNQLHLYRMVQESLTNIEKHSGASRASLVARRCLQNPMLNILICISDEGVGLASVNQDVPGSSGEGLGIRSIRQRAAIIGAKLDFISESGNGLMVRIEISGGTMEAQVD